MNTGIRSHLSILNGDGLLTPVQVAEMFQVPVRTVHALARKKKLPAIKVGRLWRFDLRELWKWIEGNCQRAIDISEIHQKAKEIVDSR